MPLPMILLLSAALLAALPTPALGDPGPLPEAPPRARAHPMDGPDVDLRLSLEEPPPEPGGLQRPRVRVTVTFNLAFLDAVIPPFREDEYTVDAEAELPLLEEKTIAFLRENLRVAAKEEALPLRVVSTTFDPGDPATAMQFPITGLKGVMKLTVQGEFPLTEPPSRLSITWSSYPLNPVLEDASGIPTMELRALFIAEGSDQEFVFHADEPEIIWHRSGRTLEDRLAPVPAPVRRPARWPLSPVVAALLWAVLARTFRRWWISILALPLLAAAAWWTLPLASVPSPLDSRPALPSDAEAQEIFRELHRNMYVSFEYTNERQVYEVLERSVADEMLSRVFREITESLIVRDEGGAQSRFRELEHLACEIEPLGQEGGRVGFLARARWRVQGEVVHWQHRHERTNEYEGWYEVRNLEEGWLLTDGGITDSKVVEATPGGGESPR